MIPVNQIPRNVLVWIFLSQLLTLLPHIVRTPIWVSLLWCLCIFWRIQVFKGCWNFPNKIVKGLLLTGTVIGLVTSFPGFFGLEALVSTLLIAYGLKLLEMYRKRDALVLLYLSIFVIATGFLFEQAIWLALFNLFAVMVVLAALMGIYQTNSYSAPFYSFCRAGVMVLQALPVMMVMFVVFPRVQSFWSVPLQENTPKTGMSDSMSLESLTRLIQSTDPVMRISFDGSRPAKEALYWRGLVFSKFDGTRWEPHDNWPGPAVFIGRILNRGDTSRFYRRLEQLNIVPDKRSPIKYEVILESHQTPWLYALSVPIPETENIWLTHEQLLSKNGKVQGRFKYRVSTGIFSGKAFELPAWQRQLNTQLPDVGNPHARRVARQWRQESKTDKAYVEYLLDWYNKEFYYTLKPPQVGTDVIDGFLFSTRKGFCEHFASSFVFMLRAAGIPARVVAGYQGGEYNDYENYYLVRQYDAHAWAEIWMEGAGWVKYDPTFAVAPQRILNGFRETFDQDDELNIPLLSLDRYRNIELIHWLSKQTDRLNYNWARFVLAYNTDKQTQFLSGFSLGMITLISLGVVMLLLGGLYATLLWQERDRIIDPVLRAYLRLCKRLNKQGFKALLGETPEVYLRRLAIEQPKNSLTWLRFPLLCTLIGIKAMFLPAMK